MALSEEPGRHTESESRFLTPGATELSYGRNEILKTLRGISLNEHYCPDILPFNEEVISTIRDLVNAQTDELDNEEDESSDAHTFELQLKRMEIDRINYLLRDYFRMRIKKIEGNVLFIFKDSAAYDLLSKNEQTFAVGFMDLLDEHFKKSFLSMLPKKVQILDKDGDSDPAAGPDLNGFVFCRVKRDVGSYMVGDEANDDTLDLNEGDTLCIRYKSIRQLVLDGDVELV